MQTMELWICPGKKLLLRPNTKQTFCKYPMYINDKNK